MSETKKKTLTDLDLTTDRPIGRRSSMAVLGAGVLGTAMAAVGIAAAPGSAHAIPGCTDRDPTDPAGNGRGRGISDSDPRDPVGCGSRACSDADPHDPAGRGRHC
jgi:hypothetical protein